MGLVLLLASVGTPALTFRLIFFHFSEQRLAETNTMHQAALLLFWPFAALVLYWVVSYITTSHRRAAMAKKLGCEPLPVYTWHKDPLGLGNVMEIIKENDLGRLPHHVVERFARISRQENRNVMTFTGHIFRNWLIATCDPKNIQAILATQFKEFELGPIRFGTFSPL